MHLTTQLDPYQTGSSLSPIVLTVVRTFSYRLGLHNVLLHFQTQPRNGFFLSVFTFLFAAQRRRRARGGQGYRVNDRR